MTTRHIFLGIAIFLAGIIIGTGQTLLIQNFPQIQNHSHPTPTPTVIPTNTPTPTASPSATPTPTPRVIAPVRHQILPTPTPTI